MNIIGCATLLENALKEWQNVTLPRRVDTFNVPSPSSHYRPPYAYAWTTLFFSIILHPSTVHRLETTGEFIQRRVDWRGTRPDMWMGARVGLCVLFSFVMK